MDTAPAEKAYRHGLLCRGGRRLAAVATHTKQGEYLYEDDQTEERGRQGGVLSRAQKTGHVMSARKTLEPRLPMHTKNCSWIMHVAILPPFWER